MNERQTEKEKDRKKGKVMIDKRRKDKGRRK